MGGSKAFESPPWVFFNHNISLEKGTIAPLGIVATIKQIDTENKVETTLFHYTPLGNSSSKRQEIYAVVFQCIPRFSDHPKDAPLGFLDQKCDITIVFANSTCLDGELH